MRFEDFIRQGKVKVGEIDIQKAKSLIKMSENTFSFIDTLKVTEESASTVFTSSYDSFRQVLEAVSLLKGFKVYSHEAYTYYLIKLNEEQTAQQFDRLRKLRNGINYYGKPVPAPVAADAKEQVRVISKKLKEKYLKF